MGRKGIARMNKNGERLAEFHALNGLVIGEIFFNHKDIHKLTLTSPNGRDRNQIDHIINNGRSKSFRTLAAGKLSLLWAPRFSTRPCFFT